jgi:phage-related baseplate assembly protein
MILEKVPLPDVLKVYDYEALLTENISSMRTLIPDWHPSEGDVPSIILEALSYRELHLRAYFNQMAKAFFLTTATGADLDNYAVFYGLERLQGSYPTANYRFELVATLTYDVLVPKGSTLIDEGGTKRAILLKNVTIEEGKEYADGVVELQEYCESSDIVIKIMQNPLPYLVNSCPLEPFTNGKSQEGDEKFRERILLSFADKSTAGSEETYKSYTFKADNRIEDVSVFAPFKEGEKDGSDCMQGVVVVVIYAPTDIEDIAIDRVEESLNREEIRPLTDHVVVQHAKVINYTIEATLLVYPNQNSAQIYTEALESLDRGLATLEKINADITLSELNSFLRVAGVKEVKFKSPTERFTIDRESIAICDSKKINYEVYYEEL